MKTFFTEFGQNYNTYSFGYTQHCLLEHMDEVPEIYELGFLPYSADPSLKKPIFYKARSLRLNLEEFRESSEKRRLNKKIAMLNIQHSLEDAETFDWKNPRCFDLCLDYSKHRFSSEANFDAERLQFIFEHRLLSHIFTYQQNGEPLAYILCVKKNEMAHYWFSFFDLAFIQSHSIGKWLMLDVAEKFKSLQLKYLYLGTGYGTKALYKIRDFPGIEYHNGNVWSTDKTLLKKLCGQDETVHAESSKD